MSCHDRRCPLCVLSQGGDVMQRLTSSDRVRYPRVGCHATSDVVRPCVLPKGDDGMPRPTPSYRVCYSMAVMSCHAQRRLTVRVVLGRLWHATPNVI